MGHQAGCSVPGIASATERRTHSCHCAALALVVGDFPAMCISLLISLLCCFLVASGWYVWTPWNDVIRPM